MFLYYVSQNPRGREVIRMTKKETAQAIDKLKYIHEVLKNLGKNDDDIATAKRFTREVAKDLDEFQAKLFSGPDCEAGDTIPED